MNAIDEEWCEYWLSNLITRNINIFHIETNINWTPRLFQKYFRNNQFNWFTIPLNLKWIRHFEQYIDFNLISSHPNLRIAWIVHYPTKLWDWKQVTYHSNITDTIIKKYPQFPWYCKEEERKQVEMDEFVESHSYIIQLPSYKHIALSSIVDVKNVTFINFPQYYPKEIIEKLLDTDQLRTDWRELQNHCFYNPQWLEKYRHDESIEDNILWNTSITFKFLDNDFIQRKLVNKFKVLGVYNNDFHFEQKIFYQSKMRHVFMGRTTSSCLHEELMAAFWHPDRYREFSNYL